MPPTVTIAMMLTTTPPLCRELECNNDDDDYVRKAGIAILSMIGFGILFALVVYVVIKKISNARKKKAQRKQAAQDLLKKVAELDGETDTKIELEDITYFINDANLTRPPVAVTKGMEV